MKCFNCNAEHSLGEIFGYYNNASEFTAIFCVECQTETYFIPKKTGRSLIDHLVGIIASGLLMCLFLLIVFLPMLGEAILAYGALIATCAGAVYVYAYTSRLSQRHTIMNSAEKTLDKKYKMHSYL